MNDTKECQVNGTTHNIELSYTGMLKEDINYQFYSEAFILLPVSDGYANVTLASSQVPPSRADVDRGTSPDHV
jgi:hypothetical protein